MDNRSISHTRWKCQYHIVFIPKYRKKEFSILFYEKKNIKQNERINWQNERNNIQSIKGDAIREKIIKH